MTHAPHYDIITPPCTIYSLASKGECPLECSSFIVLQILRSIPLSSIPYFMLRIRPLTFFPPTKARPQLQNTFLKAYWNTSPHQSSVILRAFSASLETWYTHDPQSCNTSHLFCGSRRIHWHRGSSIVIFCSVGGSLLGTLFVLLFLWEREGKLCNQWT